MTKGQEALEGIKYCSDVLKINHKIGSRDIANQEQQELVERMNIRIPIIEKELKALEIIKEKNVNVLLLKLAETVDEYNERIVIVSYKLTKEEFDLLKEVL